MAELWSLDENAVDAANKEDEEKPVPNRYVMKKRAQIMVESKSKKKGMKAPRGTTRKI